MLGGFFCIIFTELYLLTLQQPSGERCNYKKSKQMMGSYPIKRTCGLQTIISLCLTATPHLFSSRIHCAEHFIAQPHTVSFNL